MLPLEEEPLLLEVLEEEGGDWPHPPPLAPLINTLISVCMVAERACLFDGGGVHSDDDSAQIVEWRFAC